MILDKGVYAINELLHQLCGAINSIPESSRTHHILDLITETLVITTYRHLILTYYDIAGFVYYEIMRLTHIKSDVWNGEYHVGVMKMRAKIRGI